MKALRAAVAACLVSAVIAASAAPANAARLRIADRAGDTPQRGLDVIGAAFANGDRAVVSRLTFLRDRPGTVVVMVKIRHGSGFYVVSEHGRTGPDNTYLVARSGEVVTDCRGLASSWDRDNALLRLRTPARCLDQGNYGAVRQWALTETRDGGDVDYAPEDSRGDLDVTHWVSRG